MGLDIWGWVEVNDGRCWNGVADLSKELERNYSAFSLLFGVRKMNLIPLGHQGAPSEMSKEIRECIEGYPENILNWILWSEISHLEFKDNLVNFTVYDTELYLKTKQGEVFKGIKEIPDLLGGEDYLTLLKEGVFETHRYVYRTAPKEEEFYFDDGWFKLFELAKEEEEKHGENSVRFTAYFE